MARKAQAKPYAAGRNQEPRPAAGVHWPSGRAASDINSALLKSSMADACTGDVGAALALRHMLSARSAEAIGASYRSGFSHGRSLYGIVSVQKPGRMDGEYMALLAQFLESVGACGVSVGTSPEGVVLRLHGTGARLELGANVHHFEAGIISGFLSAMTRRHVAVQETECRDNGAMSCSFATRRYHGSAAHSLVPDAAIERFAVHIARSTSPGARGAVASSAYCAMLSSPLAGDAAHAGAARAMRLLGSSLGAASASRNRKLTIARIAATMHRMGLGAASVRAARPLKMGIAFDHASSSRKFVELSLAFLGSALEQGIKTSDIDTTLMAANGRYSVRLRER